MQKYKIVLFLLIFIVLNISADENMLIKVGTYENEPKIYTNEDGNVDGFWADITEYIARQENWKIEWVHGSWNECLDRLENNEIDLMVDVGETPARQKRFQFCHKLVYLSWNRIYKQPGSNIQTILDLDGKKIAALTGSFDLEGPKGLKEIKKSFKINCEIIGMDNYNDIFKAIQLKKIDAGLTDKDFGNINENIYKVTPTNIILQPTPMLYACNKFSKKTPILIKQIDKHIEAIKNDDESIYYKSLDKHLHKIEEVTILPIWIKFVLIIIVILAIFFYIINRILKKRLRHKTEELRKDIIKRRKAEKDLKKEKEFYRDFINSMQDWVWEMDKKGIHTFSNPAIKNMLGYEVNEIIGTHVTKLWFEKHENEKEFKHLAKTLEAGKGWTKHKTIFKHKNGSEVYVESTAIPIFDEKGKLKGYRGVDRDITERISAEKRLKESELKNKTILEAIPDLMFIQKEDGTYLDYYTPDAELLYFKPENFLNKKPEDIFPKQFAAAIMKNIKTVLEKDSIQIYEYSLNFNGENKHFEARTVQYQHNKVLTIIRDITKRKDAEKKLLASEKRYRELFENSRDGLVAVDLKGHIWNANEAYCKMLGYSLEELKNLDNFYEITPSKWHEWEKKEIWDKRLFKKGYTGIYEKEYIRKDGSIFPVELQAFTVYDKDNNPMFFWGIARDITKRKNSEKKLQQSEERLRTLINATPDIICFKDGKGRWLIANEADLELFSLKGVNYRNKTDAELAEYTKPIYKEAFLTCEQTDEKAWQKGSISRSEEIIPVNSEKSKTFDVIKIPLFKNDGSRKGIVVLGRDITKRKVAEEQIKKDLEEKKVLLREIYHRTKNNMQVIASMLKTQSQKSKNLKIQKKFQEINNKIRAMSLVHQKLYQAKDLSQINLKEYIQDLVKSLISSYRISSSTISLNLQLKDAHALIDTAVPLGLVLNELLSNVFEHAFPNNKKGTLTINLEKDKNDIIKIYVADDGIGIAPELDIKEISKVGINTVFMLIEKQLNGKVSYQINNGIEWYIEYKDDLSDKRV